MDQNRAAELNRAEDGVPCSLLANAVLTTYFRALHGLKGLLVSSRSCTEQARLDKSDDVPAQTAVTHRAKPRWTLKNADLFYVDLNGDYSS